jgi:RimJ/RimL family protein N-acetyltransferase
MIVSPIRTARLDLVPFDPVGIRHLMVGQRKEAEHVLGLTVPQGFPTSEDVSGFLAIQLQRMEAFPDQRDWTARLMVTRDNEVTGHCGFTDRRS